MLLVSIFNGSTKLPTAPRPMAATLRDRVLRWGLRSWDSVLSALCSVRISWSTPAMPTLHSSRWFLWSLPTLVLPRSSPKRQRVSGLPQRLHPWGWSWFLSYSCLGSSSLLRKPVALERVSIEETRSFSSRSSIRSTRPPFRKRSEVCSVFAAHRPWLPSVRRSASTTKALLRYQVNNCVDRGTVHREVWVTCRCRRGRVRQGRNLDLRDDVESRMSHTAMQVVLIKTVHMLCKQQRRCTLERTTSCYVTETSDTPFTILVTRLAWYRDRWSLQWS